MTALIIKRSIALVGTGAMLLGISTAQSAPEDPIFTKELRANICNDNDIVNTNLVMSRLLGEVGVDMVVLYENRSALALPEGAPFLQVISEWFAVPPARVPAGLDDKIYMNLERAAEALSNQLVGLLKKEAPKPDEYRARLSPAGTMDQIIGEQVEVLRAFFRKEEIGAGPRLDVLCPLVVQTREQTEQPDVPSQGDPKDAPPSPRVLFALRGSSTDLLIDSSNTSAFKKASSAEVGYVDNNVKDTVTIGVNSYVGLGVEILSKNPYRRPPRFIAYLGYKQVDVDTDDPTDDDSKNDIRYANIGALASGQLKMMDLSSVGDNFGIIAGYGVDAFYTKDNAQRADSFRGKFFLKDIVLEVPGLSAPLCNGPTRRFFWLKLPLGLYSDCSIETFADTSLVFDAGNSTDFQSLDDDKYAGIGGNVSVVFAFDTTSLLKNLKFTTGVRYMAILYGDLDNPYRFETSLAYEIPTSGFHSALALSFVTGQDFVTFQKEEALKLSFKLKF